MVSRGEAWGEPGPLPPDAIIVSSDAEARKAVEDARRNNDDLPTLGLVGGDLWRTLGGRSTEERLRSDGGAVVQVDMGAALIDGRLHWFVAHLTARRSWWRGPALVVMNAAFRGSWNLGPRAHPGDGVLDVYEGSLSLTDRLKARGRLASGSHVPHPDITYQRADAFQRELTPTAQVELDGVALGPAAMLSVRVEPAVLTVVV